MSMIILCRPPLRCDMPPLWGSHLLRLFTALPVQIDLGPSQPASSGRRCLSQDGVLETYLLPPAEELRRCENRLGQTSQRARTENRPSKEASSRSLSISIQKSVYQSMFPRAYVSSLNHISSFKNLHIQIEGFRCPIGLQSYLKGRQLTKISQK